MQVVVHLKIYIPVNAPPSNGPTTEDIPNILDKAAIYIGRFLSGTVKPTIVIPPAFLSLTFNLAE